MKNKDLKEISILIMEDDPFYNNLLARKFSVFQNQPYIKNNYRLNIEQYETPKDCLKRVKSDKNNHLPSIAFIDYYMGDGINGQHLAKILVNRNEKFKIVIMSHSEKVIEGTSTFIEDHTYTKVLKHQYTPELCCMMLDHYIHNIEI